MRYTSSTREDRKRVTVLECGELCHALCAHLHCLSTLKGGLLGAGLKYVSNTVHTKYDSQHQLSKMDKSDQRKLSDCVEERSHDAFHPPPPYSLSYACKLIRTVGREILAVKNMDAQCICEIIFAD